VLYYIYDGLQDNYGEWDLQEIDDNEARLDEPWDGCGSIEPILDKFDEVAELAEMGGSPVLMIKNIIKLLREI
jgi:hypothetical protein